MKTTILILTIILFSSCEGVIRISGKIISDKTETPVEGAKIELLDIPPAIHFDSLRNAYDSSFLSDKNGNFTASSRIMGMIFGPPKYRIRITKNGYQAIEIKINPKDKNRSNLFKLIEN